jgi:CubicO group peptidase (beta-lactamase class C family)
VVPVVTVTESDVQGTCDDSLSGVRDEFLRNFAGRDDVGAAVSVSVDGETVIDLWAGHTDADRKRPTPSPTPRTGCPTPT